MPHCKSVQNEFGQRKEAVDKKEKRGLAERDKEKQAMKSVDERSHCQGGWAEWKF